MTRLCKEAGASKQLSAEQNFQIMFFGQIQKDWDGQMDDVQQKLLQ